MKLACSTRQHRLLVAVGMIRGLSVVIAVPVIAVALEGSLERACRV